MNHFNHTVYTKTANFRGDARALTEGELRQLAPSIFAVDKHESRSERFKPIPTWEVLQGLISEGFAIVGARQSTTRDPGKAPFTKHLVRIRKLDGSALTVNDSVCEALLKNANDGTAGYDLMGGLWRILCDNSLVSPTSTMDSVKVRHTGDVAAKVIEGTYRVVGNMEAIAKAPQDWASIRVTKPQAVAYAEAAHMLRFGEPEEGEATQQHFINPTQLLAPRRNEDMAPTLWNVFNVVQENAIRGGLNGYRTDAETGNVRRATTRAIKGIDQDVKLNRALWALTEKMAKLAA